MNIQLFEYTLENILYTIRGIILFGIFFVIFFGSAILLQRWIVKIFRKAFENERNGIK